MTSSQPRPFDGDYADLLASRKSDFISEDGSIAQHGAALLGSANPCPHWPNTLESQEPVIETFVVSSSGSLAATSDNEPFVSAWRPVAAWMVAAVHSAFQTYNLAIDGDAYLTASLTHVCELEGMSHMDDDLFTPDDNVSAVAIIGQLAGPRVATGSLPHPTVKPMSQVQFDDTTHDDFAAGHINCAVAAADELVIFPQFGQLHAGPSADDLATHPLAPQSRQLLVYRARIAM